MPHAPGTPPISPTEIASLDDTGGLTDEQIDQIIAKLQSPPPGSAVGPRQLTAEERELAAAQAALARIQAELLPAAQAAGLTSQQIQDFLSALNLQLSAELGRGQLALSQDELKLQERLGLAGLNLSQEELELAQELGRAGVQLSRDEFELARQLGKARLDLSQQEFGLAQELGRGELGLGKERIALGVGQLDLARELGLADIGLRERAQTSTEQEGFAARASNPRRILEAIFLQSRREPTQGAKALQDLVQFHEGGVVSSLADSVEGILTRAHEGIPETSPRPAPRRATSRAKGAAPLLASLSRSAGPPGRSRFRATGEGALPRTASVEIDPLVKLALAFSPPEARPSEAQALGGANAREFFRTIRESSDPTRTAAALRNIARLLQSTGKTPAEFIAGTRAHGPRRATPKRSALGRVVGGPTVLLVGEGKRDAGVTKGFAEYVLAPPGTVVAPAPRGEKPSMEGAHRALIGQIERSAHGYPSPEKAKKILRHGKARGKRLTKRQKGFLGLIAGGGTPTRAQGGISLAPPRQLDRRAGPGGPVASVEDQLAFLENLLDRAANGQLVSLLDSGRARALGFADLAAVITAVGNQQVTPDKLIGLIQNIRRDLQPPGFRTTGLPFVPTAEPPAELTAEEIEELRRRVIDEVLGGTAPTGTSLFDPLGGGTFTPEQRSTLSALNQRDLNRLSPTQTGTLEAALSAGQVAPEDFFTSRRRQLVGANPVLAGTSTRFGGIL